MTEKVQSKREKKLDERKELQAKLKEAQEKFNAANKIMKNDQKSENEILKAVEKYSEAIVCLQLTDTDQEKQNKDEKFAQYYAARGRALKEMRQYQKALFDFTAAIKFQETKAQYWGDRGDCSYKLDNIKEAQQDYEKAIQLNENDGQQYLNRGGVLARQQQYELAIKDFDKALLLLSKQSDVTRQFKSLFHRGNCYRALKDYKKSILDLEEAVKKKQDSAPAYNNLGLSYFEDENYDQALDKFCKAIELDDKAAYYNNKALALQHKKQLTLAIVEYDKAYEIDKFDSKTLYNRGNTYLSLGENQKAQQDFDEAIKIEPNNSKFYHSKGLAYQDIGDYLNAMTQFKNALKIHKDDIPSIFHLGMMEHKSGDLMAALDSFSRVKAAIGEDRLVLESRGLVYQDMKNHEKAIQDFDFAIEIEPTYAETYYYRGISKIELGMISKAIEDFYNAQKYNSKNPGIFSGLGQCFRLQNNLPKALQYLNDALERSPENEEFLVQRSNIYLDQGKFIEGINDLTVSLAKKPQDPQILYKRGLIYYKNNQYEQAIKDLFRSEQNQPYNSYLADIYYHLGLSYARIELYERSIQPLSQAIEIQKFEACYYHERAKCYHLIGEYDKAIQDFSQVIKMQPCNSHAFFGRAFSYKNNKQFKEASDDFFKAHQIEPENHLLCVNFKQVYNVEYIKLCQPGEEMK